MELSALIASDGSYRAAADQPGGLWSFRARLAEMMNTDRTDDTVDAQIRSSEWKTTASLLLVVFALIALVVVPVLAGAFAQRLVNETRTVTHPAGAIVTQIQLDLALEASALGDYSETGASHLLERYHTSVTDERVSYARLEPLAESLGPDVLRRLEEVTLLEDDWHHRVDSLLRSNQRAAVRFDSLHRGKYEALLLAVARMDAAISSSAERSNAQILRIERMQGWIALALALIGALGVAGAEWLSRRVRLYASQAEQHRAELQRAIQSRARWMRGISHDLKNPLNAIDGHAQLLDAEVRGPVSPGQRDSLARIRNSVRSVLSLIDDLLELSRVEAGQLRVQRSEVSLEDVVRESYDEHRASAEAAGHTLQLDIQNDLPPVVTDSARVQQIIGNLLSNAVKYTPNGGTITLRTHESARGAEPGIAIDVSDTGPGIPPDKLEAVFHEFSRLEQHVSKPGAGVGLSIARGIARMLGGDVNATSVASGSATFTLWLPIA
jgi:signal transduction histidine kinase